MGTAHFYGHFTFCTSERERGKGRTPRFCAYATLVHEAPGLYIFFAVKGLGPLPEGLVVKFANANKQH